MRLDQDFANKAATEERRGEDGGGKGGGCSSRQSNVELRSC